MTTFDLSEYLRQKKLQDAFNPSLSEGSEPGPQDLPSRPPSAPVQAPGANPDEARLRSVMQTEPNLADYHPSKLRNVMSKIAGIGYGIASGSPLQGMALADRIQYAPFSQQMSQYQQKLGQAKNLEDIGVASETRALKGQETQAQIEAHKAGAASSLAGEAEHQATQKLRERELQVMPPDYQTSQQGKLDLAKIEHPEKVDKYVLSLDSKSGRALVMDSATGQTRVEVVDPDQGQRDLEGTMKQLSVAQGLIDDPKVPETDPRKKAAKIFVKSVEEAKQQQPPQAMMLGAPDQAGNRTAQVIHPGSVVAPGSMSPQQAGQEQVQSDKEGRVFEQAKKEASVAYQNAAKLAAAPSPTNDYALVMQFISATKPDGLGKLRLNNNEINLVYGTRSALGGIEALLNKLQSGQSLTPKQRSDMLTTMKLLSSGGTESQSGAPGAAPTNPQDPMNLFGGK